MANQVPVTALLTQRNVEEASRAVGINPNTLLRWMKIPEFDKEYRAARRASVSQSNARFQQATSAAASIIMKLNG